MIYKLKHIILNKALENNLSTTKINLTIHES